MTGQTTRKICLEMDENTEHSCENCTHCDVLDYYCYKKYKPIEFDDGTDCEEWELYEE